MRYGINFYSILMINIEKANINYLQISIKLVFQVSIFCSLNKTLEKKGKKRKRCMFGILDKMPKLKHFFQYDKKMGLRTV